MHSPVVVLCILAAFATVATAVNKEDIPRIVGTCSYKVHELVFSKLKKDISDILTTADSLSQQICVQLLIPKASLELLGPMELRTKDMMVNYMGTPQADLDRLTEEEVRDKVERKLEQAVPAESQTLKDMKNCVAKKVMNNVHSRESRNNQ